MMVKTRAHDEMGCRYIYFVIRRFPAALVHDEMGGQYINLAGADTLKSKHL